MMSEEIILTVNKKNLNTDKEKWKIKSGYYSNDKIDELFAKEAADAELKDNLCSIKFGDKYIENPNDYSVRHGYYLNPTKKQKAQGRERGTYVKPSCIDMGGRIKKGSDAAEALHWGMDYLSWAMKKKVNEIVPGICDPKNTKFSKDTAYINPDNKSHKLCIQQTTVLRKAHGKNNPMNTEHLSMINDLAWDVNRGNLSLKDAKAKIMSEIQPENIYMNKDVEQVIVSNLAGHKSKFLASYNKLHGDDAVKPLRGEKLKELKGKLNLL